MDNIQAIENQMDRIIAQSQSTVVIDPSTSKVHALGLSLLSTLGLASKKGALLTAIQSIIPSISANPVDLSKKSTFIDTIKSLMTTCEEDKQATQILQNALNDLNYYDPIEPLKRRFLEIKKLSPSISQKNALSDLEMDVDLAIFNHTILEKEGEALRQLIWAELNKLERRT